MLPDDPRQIDAESNASLSADEALLRVRTGVTLILLEVPIGSTVTLDLRSFVTGPTFRGFKAVPPSRTHLITMAPRQGSDEGVPAGTTGVFFDGKEGDVLTTRYCASSETFTGVQNAPFNLRRDVKLLRLDSELGFYSKAADSSWAPLVACIDATVLGQMGVLPGTCISGAGQNLVSLKERSGDADGMESHTRSISFTPIDTRASQRGMTAEEITRYNMDRSQLVEQLIRTRFDGKWERLIGELQVSFLTFLLLLSLEGLEHWKVLVNLLTECDHLQLEYPDLFVRFIVTLLAQMQVIPVEVFTEDPETNNFLKVALKRFFVILSEHPEGPVNDKLCEVSRKFREFLIGKYGWSLRSSAVRKQGTDLFFDLENDSGDDGPTIVPYHEVRKILEGADKKTSMKNEPV